MWNVLHCNGLVSQHCLQKGKSCVTSLAYNISGIFMQFDYCKVLPYITVLNRYLVFMYTINVYFVMYLCICI